MNRINSVVFAGIAGFDRYLSGRGSSGWLRPWLVLQRPTLCAAGRRTGYGGRDYGPPVIGGRQLRLDLGGGRDEARYSPPNPRFKTWKMPAELHRSGRPL